MPRRSQQDKVHPPTRDISFGTDIDGTAHTDITMPTTTAAAAAAPPSFPHPLALQRTLSVMDLSVSNPDDSEHFGKGKEEAARSERKTLAKRETRFILILRVMVGIVFVILALATSATVYFYIRDGQRYKYRSEFEFHAEKVLESFHLVVEQKLAGADTLSVSATSHAMRSKVNFPNVTLPDFELKGSNARIIGDTVMTFYMPVVTDETREGWEAYSRENNDHLLETLEDEAMVKAEQDAKYGFEAAAATEPVDYLNNITLRQQIPGEIWSPDAEVAEGPYLPIWQISPVLTPDTKLINKDLRRAFYAKGSIDVVLSTGQASLDKLTNLADGDSEVPEDDASEIFDLLLQHGQFRHASKRYTGGPLSALSYPVFNRFGKGKEVVGVLFTLIYWRYFFANILPANINGIVCVLSNTFGQKATYRIDGGDVVFLGNADYHDDEYEAFRPNAGEELTLDQARGFETRSFTTADLNLDYINYELKIYPSDQFRDLYMDRRAHFEAGLVLAIFMVAALIFVAYDCCVERRQRIVFDRAVKSSAVVSSLFPETVRDRVLNDGNQRSAGDQTLRSSSHQKRSTWRTRTADSDTDGDESNTSSPPIAEKFASCTVFFADIAGFTKWSSDRAPEQVFELLEALFKAFDEAAMRRGVFKVETIGDCYMAVTGLPKPQNDHAIRMAKFSHDCIRKLQDTIDQMSGRLGAGTENLALRIGMNSGPVTAGVLRGEKSRFQLFGDTVNTASRMESTGTPGRIQISQSTADSLILNGKAAWLVPREDKVLAKGKGAMQTYWIRGMESYCASVTTASASMVGTGIDDATGPRLCRQTSREDSDHSIENV